MKAIETIGYLPGSFDILGGEDLFRLRSAAAQCDFLFAGVLGDEPAISIAGSEIVQPFDERLEIIRNLEMVSAAVGQLTTSLEEIWNQLRFDKLFLDPDLRWVSGALDEMTARGVEIIEQPGGGMHSLAPIVGGNEG